MPNPFPGMDPYVEHPVIWEPVHHVLATEIMRQLGKQLRPRYATSVAQRVIIEAAPRLPDAWIHRTQDDAPAHWTQSSPAGAAIILDLDEQELEIRQLRVEVLDSYNAMKVVTAIEIVSPSNKRPGKGRESYITKQQEFLASDVHLVEIDLHREGRSVIAPPSGRLAMLPYYDYLVSVSRWPKRTRFEVYPVGLRQRLPTIAIPLAEPDPDGLLDLQAVFNAAHDDSNLDLRIRYEQPCDPPLDAKDQAWADELLKARKS